MTELRPANCCRSTFWTAFAMGAINAVVLILVGWGIVAVVRSL